MGMEFRALGTVSQRMILVSGGGEYGRGVSPFARIADVVETKWPFQGRTCLSFVVFEGIALRRLRLRLLFFLTLGAVGLVRRCAGCCLLLRCKSILLGVFFSVWGTGRLFQLLSSSEV